MIVTGLIAAVFLIAALLFGLGYFVFGIKDTMINIGSRLKESEGVAGSLYKTYKHKICTIVTTEKQS